MIKPAIFAATASEGKFSPNPTAIPSTICVMLSPI